MVVEDQIVGSPESGVFVEVQIGWFVGGVESSVNQFVHVRRIPWVDPP